MYTSQLKEHLNGYTVKIKVVHMKQSIVKIEIFINRDVSSNNLLKSRSKSRLSSNALL